MMHHNYWQDMFSQFKYSIAQSTKYLVVSLQKTLKERKCDIILHRTSNF